MPLTVSSLPCSGVEELLLDGTLGSQEAAISWPDSAPEPHVGHAAECGLMGKMTGTEVSEITRDCVLLALPRSGRAAAREDIWQSGSSFLPAQERA